MQPEPQVDYEEGTPTGPLIPSIDLDDIVDCILLYVCSDDSPVFCIEILLDVYCCGLIRSGFSSFVGVGTWMVVHVRCIVRSVFRAHGSVVYVWCSPVQHGASGSW
jgi:hypothetical protein